MEWYEEYTQHQQHWNLQKLLEHYLKQWQKEVCFERTHGFNLIVYTFSAMIN